MAKGGRSRQKREGGVTGQGREECPGEGEVAWGGRSAEGGWSRKGGKSCPEGEEQPVEVEWRVQGREG